jgi:hypothetical protein
VSELVQLQIPSVAPGVQLARGVARTLTQHGYACLLEVTLGNARRADVLALDPTGTIVIVEVKSSVADFRSDQKWTEYRGYCDRLFFAVPVEFPVGLIPDSCGLMIADRFEAEVIRSAPDQRLSAARRKAMTLRFAHLAAQRLTRLAEWQVLP